jgi:hypothetical protein
MYILTATRNSVFAIIEFGEPKPFRPFTTFEGHYAEPVRRWNPAGGPDGTI